MHSVAVYPGRYLANMIELLKMAAVMECHCSGSCWDCWRSEVLMLCQLLAASSTDSTISSSTPTTAPTFHGTWHALAWVCRGSWFRIHPLELNNPYIPDPFKFYKRYWVLIHKAMRREWRQQRLTLEHCNT